MTSTVHWNSGMYRREEEKQGKRPKTVYSGKRYLHVHNPADKKKNEDRQQPILVKKAFLAP